MRSEGLRPSNAELWGGVLWFAFSVFVVHQARELELGTVNEPGMGFTLFWIGLVMCLLSLTVVVHAIGNESPSLASLWAGTRWRKTLIVMASLVVFALLFSRLGFLISTTALMIVLLRAVDPVRWVLAIPVGVGMPLLIWFVMKRLLLIQLPAGMFGIG